MDIALILTVKVLSAHAAEQTPAGIAAGGDVQDPACPKAAHLFNNLPLAISAQARRD